jgi:hypothetical protein
LITFDVTDFLASVFGAENMATLAHVSLSRLVRIEVGSQLCNTLPIFSGRDTPISLRGWIHCRPTGKRCGFGSAMTAATTALAECPIDFAGGSAMVIGIRRGDLAVSLGFRPS